jgi:hypothetical protein
MSVSLFGSASYNTGTGVYTLTTNSNDAGSLQTSQNTSIQYVAQYKFYTPTTSNIPYNYYLHIGDENSNIKYVISGSNFNVTLNNTINVLTLNNIKPYITYNTSNTLAVNVSESNIYVRMNNTALARINTSNMPKDFDGASYLMIASSNPTTGNSSIFPHQVQEIFYQSTPTFENQVVFKASIKAPTIFNDVIYSSNISAFNYSNLPILDSVTSTSTSNLATPNAVKQSFDKASWSSNTAVAVSNAYYNSSTGASSAWASNAAFYGSNVAYWSSNTSFYSSNAVVWSSNTAVAVSNAYYSSSAGTASTFASNAAVFGSNTSVWASNNLLPTSGGSIYGLNVRNSQMLVYPGSDQNKGVRVIGNDQDGATASVYNGGLASWFGIGFKCLTDSTTRFVHNTRNGDTYIEGSLGIGTSNPTTKVDVNGTINATSYQGATITSLSNLGLYGSNTAYYASNLSYNMSNVSYPCSNMAFSLSNYVYSTNTTNVVGAQATANFGSNTAVSASNVAYWTSNNLLNKAGGTMAGNLTVTGATYAQGNLFVGQDNATNPGTYTTGKICFAGTYGDGGFNNAQIAVRKYDNSLERSEMILAKFNDPEGNTVGADRIRLRAAAIAFDTYNDYVTNLTGTDADFTASNIAMYVAGSGNVGIGTTEPATELDVDGVITSRYGIDCKSTLTVFSATTLQSGYDAGFNSVQTHFPYPGDGKNYIRGTTILADSSANSRVGIGTSAPASDCKLDVYGTTHTNKLRIGSSALNCTFIDSIIGNPGSCSSRKLQFTLDNLNLPVANYEVYPTVLSGDPTKDDVFAITVMEKTQAKIVVSIYRVDANSGWGQNLKIQYLIVGHD